MRYSGLLLTLAIVAALFPVYSWISWTIVNQSAPGASQPEKQERFMKYFPSFIHELNTITLINLVCLLLAILLSVIAARRSTGGVRKLSIFVFAISGLLAVLTLLAFAH